MKSARVNTIAGARADRDEPFMMTLSVKNHSEWFAIFGLDTLVMTKPPKHKLISSIFDASMATHSSWLPPGRTMEAAGLCRGLPRGVHTTLMTVQKTTFPFGILEKFKVVNVPARLIVSPRIDAEFLAEVAPLLKRLKAEQSQDLEFFSHRAYFPRDPRRDVDWKKSASRPESDWVVKQFKPIGDDGDIVVFAPWSGFATAPSDDEYERRLDRLRTLAQGLADIGAGFIVDIGGSRAVIEGLTPLVEALAAAPAFDARATAPDFSSFSGRAALENDGARVRLTFDGQRVVREGEAA